MRGSAKRSMSAAILTLEAVTLFLTGVVLIGITDLGAGPSLAIGAGFALACLLTAGLLGRPGGYAVGWVIQVGAVALGLVVPIMFFLGAVFALLWGGAVILGTRIDAEREERRVLEEQWRAEHGGTDAQGTGGDAAGAADARPDQDR